MTKTMITSEEALKKCRKLDGQILAAIKAHFESGYELLNNSMVFYVPEGTDCCIAGSFTSDPEDVKFIQLDQMGNIYVDQVISGLSKVGHGTHSTADLATILSAIEKTKA